MRWWLLSSSSSVEMVRSLIGLMELWMRILGFGEASGYISLLNLSCGANLVPTA